MTTNDRMMPGIDRDEESGKYTASYDTDDFLDAIRSAGGMAGTTEIADTVGCTRRTAYTRLQELTDEGIVTSQKVGNSIVWQVDEP